MKHLLFTLVFAVGCSALLLSCSDEAPKRAPADGPKAAVTNGSPNNSTSATNVDATATNGTTTTVTQPASVDLVAGVESLLLPLVRRDAGADDPVKLERMLMDMLEAASLGTSDTRAQVASVALKDILAKAKTAGGTGGALTALQRAALKELSRQIAADLYRRLPAGGSAHLGALLGTAKAVKMPDGYSEAPWSLLGGFAYEEGKPLPEAVRKLQDQKVGLTGYMMTLEEVEDIHEFLLVESLWSCCFGKPPEVHQVVVVTIPDKKGVDMTPAPILVTGVIDVGERVEDGFVTSVYRLKATSFKELE